MALHKNISFDHLSEENQILKVKEDFNNIKYIDNPSEKVQLEFVREYPQFLDIIIEKGIIPSEQVQLEAVKRNLWAIKYINNPSEQVQLEAVKQNIKSIFYIEKPEKEIVFYCITSSPDLLKIKEDQVPNQKLKSNYFQKLPLNIQKMLIKTNPLFSTLIPNLHDSLKDSLYNLKNIGLF